MKFDHIQFAKLKCKINYNFHKNPFIFIASQYVQSVTEFISASVQQIQWCKTK